MTAAGAAAGAGATGRVVALGESMGVVRSTEPGGFAIESAASVGFGGVESNVVIAASRLGVPSVWVSRVGDDVLGRRIVRELRAEGVEVRAVVDAEAPTGLLVKNQPRPGRTEVSYYRAGSAASRLSPADVTRLELREGDILHLTGITLALSASAREAVLAATDAARAAGARVSFDVNHRSRLWSADEARPFYRKLVARADLLFAGDDEAALVLGSSDAPEALAHALASLGAGEVVVKLGDRGAGSLVEGVWRERGVEKVAVVDTVGAGDAFVGGYLAAVLQGADPQARLDLAARNGAAACTHPGDWEGSATLRELAAGSAGDPVAR